MITLPPVQLTGAAQNVDLTVNDGCCALVQNESPYALEVQIAQTKRWLGAWEADLFDVPAGARQISWTPQLIGSLINAPSTALLVTIAEPGESFRGTYPLALTRQAGVSAGTVNIKAQPPAPVFLENAAATPLGDTSALALVADQITDTMAGFGSVSGMCAAIASFLAASGQTPARRLNAGAVVVGSNTSVSPTYGQGTGAGNLAIAVVSCGNTGGTGQLPTTAAAGWVEAVHVDPLAGFNIVSIWYKPNIGASEAAPTFTASNSTSPMIAQLLEFTGCTTSSPLDRTGSLASGGTNVANPQCSSSDAAGQDLVVEGGRWIYTSGTITYSQTVNNGATLTHDGDTTSAGRAFSVNHAINPAAPPNLPLGVQPWPVDTSGTSQPALGSVPSVVLAATPGKTYTVTDISGSLVVTTAAGDRQYLQLLDGASQTWSLEIGVVGTIDQGVQFSQAGLSRKGTSGNSATLRFGGIGANSSGTVNLGVYLR